MNKLLFLFLSVLFLLLTSCVSGNEVPELYTAVDYTEENAVNDEINTVRSLIKTDAVRALWRAALIRKNAFYSNEAEILFSECEEELLSVYKSASEKEDWICCFRIIKSLEACDSKELKKLGTSSKKLMDLIRQNTGGLKSAAESSNVRNEKKVSDYIKGTVTVYVDKGIKIEKGLGYTDAVLGSGFFISKDGYIVTNHHVISDCVDPEYEGFSRLYIKLAEDPDTRIPAKVTGYDSSLDIALIKAEVEAPYVFTLGSSSELETGTEVYAIGSPLGLEKTITRGIISATDRRLMLSARVFQLDAAVNSGNSGGPLIDASGKVQAIVFAGVQNFQGLNFAIPVEYLRNELPFLYAGGKRCCPWISGWGKTKRLPGSGTKNEGVSVFYTMPGGPLSRAGIVPGDTIVSADLETVKSLDDLQLYFMSLPENVAVKLGVLREDGMLYECPVFLESRPEYPGYEVYRHDLKEEALLPLLGMNLVHSSISNRKLFTVKTVVKGSPADEAGFSETDPIELIDFEVTKKHDSALILLSAKRRRNGWLDISMSIPCSMDNPYFF